MQGNDLTLRWLTRSELDLIELVRDLRDNPETRHESIYKALDYRARKATEGEDR